MQEEWKDIKDWEGSYQVSNLGRVRSLDRYINKLNQGTMTKQFYKGQIIKPVNCLGYSIVHLRNKQNNKELNKSIHKLVAKHFIPGEGYKKCVNHIDGIKTNNHYTNLEWCTYSENNKHAYKKGLMKIVNGKIVLDTSTGIYYDAIDHACKALGYNRTTLRDKLKGKWKNNTPLILC